MRQISKIFMLFLINISLLAASSCNKNSTESDKIGYNYRVPEQIQDGWETALLSQTGLEERPLMNLMNGLLIEKDQKNTFVLIVNKGKLVVEEYFCGDDFEMSDFDMAVVLTG